mgnify:CR=1 FL=1
MAEDILAGIGCVLLGVFSLVAWWFAMFSGSDWGEAAREMLDGAFNLGRNTIAVIEPAVGLFFLFVGLLGLADPFGVVGDSPVRIFFGVPALASLVVAVLGLIPVRLPGWMYPEWHEERRWRRREQAEWEAKYGTNDEGDGEADW